MNEPKKGSTSRISPKAGVYILVYSCIIYATVYFSLYWVTQEMYTELEYSNSSMIPAYREHQLRRWKQPVTQRNPKRAAGERGVPFIVKNKKKVERLFQRHAFNVLASDKIWLNRTLKDLRFKQCLSKKYPRKLPTVTVIIVFHNEAFSTLIRTVQSVIQTSPVSLLREVILVDDKSTRVSLKWHLNHFLRHFSIRVRIARMSVRSGVIKGRNFGSTFAKGDILVFLDSHCEATEGWLTPLVARIAEDRTRVVSPIIDVIDENTFAYNGVTDELYGGFDWKLRFRWLRPPQKILDERANDRSLPIRSPTPNGGIFAIDKQFFNYFEKFDDGLSFFGSETIEIGLAAWTCGGSVEIIPCSRVGHVFRDSVPYSFPGKQRLIILYNSARILETWMDDYRMFYYNLYPDAVRKDRGNTTHRRNMRDDLKCHSFTWYLENVFPESTFPMYYKYFGQIENTYSKYCLDTVHNLVTGAEEAKMRFCAWDQGGGTADTFTQMFVYTNNKEILTDGLCLDASEDNKVLLIRCNNETSQKWIYKRDMQLIKHQKSRLCLELLETKDALPTLSKCSSKRKEQKWFMMNNFDWRAPTHQRKR